MVVGLHQGSQPLELLRICSCQDELDTFSILKERRLRALVELFGACELNTATAGRYDVGRAQSAEYVALVTENDCFCVLKPRERRHLVVGGCQG